MLEMVRIGLMFNVKASENICDSFGESFGAGQDNQAALIGRSLPLLADDIPNTQTHVRFIVVCKLILVIS